jgi:serine protease Do
MAAKRLTNLPDWLIYIAALALLVAAADSRRQNADAPAPPPPIPGDEAEPLSPLSPFNGAKILKIPPGAAGRFATAFSIGEDGVWLTAQSAVGDCRQIAVIIAPGRGAEAKALAVPGGQLSLLTTDGGSPALPLAAGARAGEDSFVPGYPQGGAGEAAVKLLGPATERDPRRGHLAQPEQAWVEIGRTDGLEGLLGGMEGAPVIDGLSRVQGVFLGQAPRRGRLYTAPVGAVRQAMALAKLSPAAQPDSQPVTTDNYGRAADALRRDLRVVQVWCGR